MLDFPAVARFGLAEWVRRGALLGPYEPICRLATIWLPNGFAEHGDHPTAENDRGLASIESPR